MTSVAGSYVLTLNPGGVSGSGGGWPLLHRSLDNVRNDRHHAPTVAAPRRSCAARTTSVSSETITFSEPVAGFTAADLSLKLNGGANLLTTAQTLTSSDQTTFTLNNLSATVTAAAGSYTLTLSNAGITGSGLALAAGASVSWTTTASGVSPTATLTAVTTPRAIAFCRYLRRQSRSTSLHLRPDRLGRLHPHSRSRRNLMTSAQTLTTSDIISPSYSAIFRR